MKKYLPDLENKYKKFCTVFYNLSNKYLLNCIYNNH